MANRIQTFINKIATKRKEGAKISFAPSQLTRIRQDAETRRLAMIEAEQSYFPFRVKLQRMYLNTAENGFIMACIERRKDLTLLRKWQFLTPNGTEDKATTDLFFFTDAKGAMVKKEWFANFISFALDSVYYGYSLIYLGDIEDNEFKNTEVVKRWNVSPDRMIASRYEYMTTGVAFNDDSDIAKNHVYVSTPNKLGTSICGFGLFYEVSVYENILRNLIGFNSDYVEVNVAPFRQIKTYKTEEIEREALYQAGLNMASNGVAVTDKEDEIIFHPSGSGTGYVAYDNFDARLKDEIAQLILGHSDAIKSVPGKLGNDKKESPAQQALEDKQTKDGELILSIVNRLLFDKMRVLGFNIPQGTTAVLLNDNEEVEHANNLSTLATNMLKGGLQMDAEYFTEQTHIPITKVVAPPPMDKGFTPKIANKLKEMYGKY